MALQSKYEIKLISIDERDRLMQRYGGRFLYEEKAEIFGCCIKLLTDLKYVKERWEESFYPMSSNIRSHGRLIVVNDESEVQKVLYDPLSKTAFLINIDYYGWVKSIALSVAGDILEDNHGINSVHGACVDIDGKGACLIAPPRSGKRHIRMSFSDLVGCVLFPMIGSSSACLRVTRLPSHQRKISILRLI